MLQELLLSLSGHPSPLLAAPPAPDEGDNFLHSLLSPAEAALLKSLFEDLGSKHKNIRNNATKISTLHPSTVCRAVSTSVVSTHLADFQRRILEVEKDILEENSTIVGAYNAVPLSGLVGAFDGWARKLEWLSALTQYIQAPEASGSGGGAQQKQPSCTAAMLIKRLRDSTRTGYPDIEQMALDLVRVAEKTWLKQVSSWVLYGRHPEAFDFFIVPEADEGNRVGVASTYSLSAALAPDFVTLPTANSILFIGQSLNHIRDRKGLEQDLTSKMTAPELSLIPNHLAHLSTLRFPISSTGFSAAISAIRLSLSQNALQKLLPMPKVTEILHVLKDFFLLQRGEFAVALITAADDRLTSRNQRNVGQRLKSSNKSVGELASLTIKEGEVHAVLARTWTTLASLQSNEYDDVDQEVELARDLMGLSIKSVDAGSANSAGMRRERAPLISFDDLLLPSSTVLSLRVPPPLDMFLTSSDVDSYAHIHAYLLAIRRAHFRLSKLFLLSVLRRDHPSPKPCKALGALARRREQGNFRTKTMRPIWATIGSAAFFLAEIGEYFQGQVIQDSWATFYSWLVPIGAPETRANDSNLPPLSYRPGSSQAGSRPMSSGASNEQSALHDPESLTHAHRKYLTSLEHSLLLDDEKFTTHLRRHMTAIDHMSALMQRLNDVQQNLNLETDGSVEYASPHYASEEANLLAELKAASLKVASGVQGLIDSLRNIDNSRTGGRGSTISMEAMDNGFVPWSGGGVDRLLLKLDYGDTEKLASQQFNE